MGERSNVPLPHSEYTLHVVMVGTEHPGNLGAVCRSLLNHGFDSLRLVQPKCHPDDLEARNRAKHAGRVLDSCKIYDSFEDAVADCSLVVGTSGKREIGEKTQKRHFMYPWEFAERIESTRQSVALIFGEEGKGLSTEDLLRCDYLVTLPTWEGYPITNLSHAVHTLTYELHRKRVLDLQGKDEALPDIVPIERSISPEQRKVLRKAIHKLDVCRPIIVLIIISFGVKLMIPDLGRKETIETEIARIDEKHRSVVILIPHIRNLERTRHRHRICFRDR